MRNLSRSYSGRILFLLSLFLLPACSDNPVDEDDDLHSDAHGLMLVLNGIEIYRVMEGQVSCAQQPCGISVEAGEETALIATTFLDEQGRPIDAEDLDDDYRLDFEMADPSVAMFEQHAEDGKWRFHISGLQVGTTNMQLKLMHVDHADFTTPPLTQQDAITIRVTE